ncbi:MAG TPA: PIN domain-containing protein [Caulobacterales bacterium]|nr:PIN domain-containing protein [Caulobacterales bacterium]
MIACDSSSLVAFLEGGNGADVQAIVAAIKDGVLVLPPPVLTEVLSNPRTKANVSAALASLPLLDIQPGFWRRAADARATLIGKKLKARLADALIAQSCIDADVALITCDRDFRHFATHCGLKLA